MVCSLLLRYVMLRQQNQISTVFSGGYSGLARRILVALNGHFSSIFGSQGFDPFLIGTTSSYPELQVLLFLLVRVVAPRQSVNIFCELFEPTMCPFFSSMITAPESKAVKRKCVKSITNGFDFITLVPIHLLPIE